MIEVAEMIPFKKFCNKKVFTLVQVLKCIGFFTPDNDKGVKMSEKTEYVTSPAEKYVKILR